MDGWALLVGSLSLPPSHTHDKAHTAPISTTHCPPYTACSPALANTHPLTKYTAALPSLEEREFAAALVDRILRSASGREAGPYLLQQEPQEQEPQQSEDGSG